MSTEVNIHESNPAVTLTPSALAHIEKQIAKRGSGIGIRFTVKKTGCSGLSYVIDLIDEANATDKIFPANENVIIAVSRDDLPHLMGTQIDYVKHGLNHQFEYSNPNAKGSCGCGVSFTISE